MRRGREALLRLRAGQRSSPRISRKKIGNREFFIPTGPSPWKPPRHSVRMRARACARTCRGEVGGVPGRFPRSLSGSSPARSRALSAPASLARPGPTASRRPQPFVVADVRLCHGNARTGCTSGSRQGPAHAHGPPTPFPSPEACCEEPRGSGSGWGDGRCLYLERGRGRVLRGVRAGEGERMCAHPSRVPTRSALQCRAQEAGWGGEPSISGV